VPRKVRADEHACRLVTGNSRGADFGFLWPQRLSAAVSLHSAWPVRVERLHERGGHDRCAW
jgi:hypothetical protein